MEESKRIAYEARTMAQIMIARQIGACIAVDSQKRAIYNITPSTIVYRLAVKPETPLSKVYGLTPDFQSHIARWRLDHSIDAETVVRVDIAEQTVEVNRPSPDTVHYANVQWAIQPHTALCGVAYNFGRSYPLLWQLADADQPHVLIAGTTGSGKTNELMCIVLSLAANTLAADLHFSIIDLKRDPEMRLLSDLPHVAGVARELPEAVQMLRRVHAEMTMRERGSMPRDCRHVLVIDEAATLLDATDRSIRNEATRLLEDIARKCRSAAMNLIVCTQSPKNEILGSQLKALLSVRLVGAVTSRHEAECAVNLPGSGAEMLPGKGAMIYRLGRTVKRFQAPLIETPAGMVRKIAKSDTRPIFHRNTTAVEPEEVAIAPDTSTPMENVCKEFDYTGGAFPRGFVNAALSAMNGGILPTGTTFQRLRRELDTYLLTYLPQSDPKIIKLPVKVA